MTTTKLVVLSVLNMAQKMATAFAESVDGLVLSFDALDRKPKRDPREFFVPSERISTFGYHFSGTDSHFVLLRTADSLYLADLPGAATSWHPFRWAKVYTAAERKSMWGGGPPPEGQIWVPVEICKPSVQHEGEL